MKNRHDTGTTAETPEQLIEHISRLMAEAEAMIAGPVAAQTPTTPASPTPTVTSRPLYFEVLIVVVMMGVSLYVVCRSSRRN